MVVVDTNIVSELMHVDPSAKVLAWVDNTPTRQLFVTSVTEAEVRACLAFAKLDPDAVVIETDVPVMSSLTSW